jgi:hypothetical protein
VQRLGGSSKQRYTPRLVRGVATLTEHSQSPNIGFRVHARKWYRSSSLATSQFSGIIVTAKMNDIDPQAWLADVLNRIADTRLIGSTNSCLKTGDLFRRVLIRRSGDQATWSSNRPNRAVFTAC